MNDQVLRGHPAAPGAALGPAWTFAAGVDAAAGTAEEEAERAEQALRQVASELGALAEQLTAEGHAADAEIVETNRLMAADAALVQAAVAAARSGMQAGRAIATAAEPHVAALELLDDPTLAARAADLRSIARRAAEVANGSGAEPPQGAVVLANDLGPGDVAGWAKRISAIVLAAGASTAHAAIVARSLGIPLVTGIGAEGLAIPDGEQIAVDADRGLVVRRPAHATRVRVAERIARAEAEAERVRRERHDPAVTVDGRPVRLLANAGTAAEVEAALAAGAEGIGLLRSELAFIEAQGWPTEAEHAAALGPMLELLPHRIATVRTLDFGGDKTPPFLAASGAQSMLGPRGIRLALAASEGVRPQLRAVMALAGDAVVRILIPMVTEAAEIDAVREMANAARDEVAPGTPDPIVGAMIEVPAAALNAQVLARSSDFLSIGTNDLVQYTLAANRQNPDVAERAVAYHPAVVRLVSRVVGAAHHAGIPVDVCGEAAGDPEVLPLLVGFGVDELSVSPARVAQTRRLVRSLSAQRARAAAASALSAATAAEVAACATGALGDVPVPSGERLEQPGDRVERL